MPEIGGFQVEQDLALAWHFQCEVVFRSNVKTTWSTVDDYLTVLDARVVSSRQHIRRDMFNNPAAVYFDKSAQVGADDDTYGYLSLRRIFTAATYEA